MKLYLLKSSIIRIVFLLFINLLAGFIAFSNLDVSSIHLIVLTMFNLIQTLIIFQFCCSNGNFKNRFAFFSFNFAYFILLQGSYVTNIGNESFYGTHIFTNVVSISYINELKGLFYILLAQFVTFFGYVFGKRNQNNTCKDINFNHLRRYRKWSKVFMIVGGIAAYTKLFLKMSYVIRYGYLGTYLVSGNALYQNAIIDLFDRFYLLGFYGYLSTFPEMKKLKKPLIIYLFYSVCTLVTGNRGQIVINLLFIVWYFSKRDEVLPYEKIILTKKKIIILGILAVFSFSFLYEFGFSRVGKVSNSTGLFENILNFIESQGGSGRLTALGLEYRDQMLKYITPFMMIFAPVRNFLINNSFIRIFTGGILGQSKVNLRQTGSFGSVITFITNPKSYLNGAALGTSFVAELSVAFGSIGIILFTLVLGFLFNKLDNLKLNKWHFNVFLCNAFVQLAYIPRHGTLDIIPESFAAILFMIVVTVLSNSRS